MSNSAIKEAMENLNNVCKKWKVDVELKARFKKDDWIEQYDWSLWGK